MIKEINSNELDLIIDFAWDIYLQPQNSSYPRFKNKEKMKERFLRFINHTDDKILALYNNENELIGVVSLFVEIENKYLKADGIYVESNHDFVYDNFINHFKNNYFNCKIYFSYPLTNQIAINLMEKNNATILETSIVTNLNKKDFKILKVNNKIEIINKDNFDSYALFHDKTYPTIYWNSKRLKENINDWRIFVIKKNDVIVASMFIYMKLFDPKQAEIFGITSNSDYALSLLVEGLPTIFNENKEKIVYFTNEVELNIALEVGFNVVDDYICYEMKL